MLIPTYLGEALALLPDGVVEEFLKDKVRLGIEKYFLMDAIKEGKNC